jgi:ketosteroid isomerase-like protein
MTRRVRVLISLAFLGLLAACTANGAGHGTIEQVKQVEKQRFAAMTAPDLTALGQMLADELYYCHSNGDVQNKQQLLDALRTKQLRYSAIELREFQARMYGDVALGNGLATIHASMGGGPLMTLEIRYADAYVWREGRWQLVTWQSTRIPVQR